MTKLKIPILTSMLLLFVSCSTDPSKLEDTSQLEPWGAILNSARYAQNAHNIQSWAFYGVQQNQLTGGLHDDRLLPQTDPYNRQLVLSLGALTTAARVSAAKDGQKLTAKWIGPETIPEANVWPEHLFTWQLKTQPVEFNQHQYDALSSATTKYATHAVTVDIVELEKLAKLHSNELVRFSIIAEPSQLNRLKANAKDAFRVEMTTHRTTEESLIYTRYGKRARQRQPYGITLLPNFEKSKVRFIEFAAGLFPQSPEAYGKQAIKIFEPTIDRAQVMIAMTTRGNTPEIWFEAGQSMQAFWADMITQNLSMLPLSQGLQEYPEVSENLDQFQTLLARNEERVQMLWSVTQPDEGEYLRSPRIDVADLLY